MGAFSNICSEANHPSNRYTTAGPQQLEKILAQARVYFKGGQYVSVGADCVFEAVASAMGASSMLCSTEVVKVELDIIKRYLAEPAYV